jgi:hypothetical protein
MLLRPPRASPGLRGRDATRASPGTAPSPSTSADGQRGSRGDSGACPRCGEANCRDRARHDRRPSRIRLGPHRRDQVTEAVDSRARATTVVFRIWPHGWGTHPIVKQLLNHAGSDVTEKHYTPDDPMLEFLCEQQEKISRYIVARLKAA